MTLEQLAEWLEAHGLWCYREMRGQDQLNCKAAAAAVRELAIIRKHASWDGAPQADLSEHLWGATPNPMQATDDALQRAAIP